MQSGLIQKGYVRAVGIDGIGYNFSGKSAELSPHVRSFLLLVGGTANTDRSALSRFVVTKGLPEEHQ